MAAVCRVADLSRYFGTMKSSLVTARVVMTVRMSTTTTSSTSVKPPRVPLRAASVMTSLPGRLRLVSEHEVAVDAVAAFLGIRAQAHEVERSRRRRRSPPVHQLVAPRVHGLLPQVAPLRPGLLLDVVRLDGQVVERVRVAAVVEFEHVQLARDRGQHGARSLDPRLVALADDIRDDQRREDSDDDDHHHDLDEREARPAVRTAHMRLPGCGLHTIFPSSKMGRRIDNTMNPTTRARATIMTGSRRDVSRWAAISISSS